MKKFFIILFVFVSFYSLATPEDDLKHFLASNSFSGISFRIPYINTFSSSLSYQFQSEIYGDEDSFVSALMANTFAITYSSSLSSPLVVPNTSLTFSSSRTQNSFIRCLEFTNLYFGVTYLPKVQSFYKFVSSILIQGYDGSGVVYRRSNDRSYVNFNFPSFVNDVIIGTNNVYRQQLFSYLGSISSSINLINSSVNSINSDYQAVNSVYLDPTNFIPFFASGVSQSEQADISSFLSNLPPARQSEIVSAFASASRSRLDDIYRYWLDYNTDPSSPAFGCSLASVLSDRPLQDQLLSFGSGRSSMSNIVHDVKRLSTNDWVSAVKQSLSNNTEKIKSDLQDWRRAATNQLAHMFADDSDGNTPAQNLERIAIGADTAAGVLGAASNPDGSLNVNLNNMTITVEAGIGLSDDLDIIKSYLVDNSASLGGLSTLSDYLSNLYSEWHDLWGERYSLGYAALQYIQSPDSTKNLHDDLTSIKNAIPSTNYFDSSLNYLTNFLANLDSTNSFDLSAVLLDDYENFVNSQRFSELLSIYSSYDEAFDSDISSLLYDETSSRYGRWWNFKTTMDYTSSLYSWSNALLSASIISTMNSNYDSVMGAFHSMTSSLPETSEVVSNLERVKNQADEVFSSFEYVTNSVSAFSNSFDSVSRLYRSTNLPSELTLLRLNDQVHFTISTAPLQTAFTLMHYGLAFCYSVVALLLFPKFILFLFNLFFKFFNRFLVLHKSS